MTAFDELNCTVIEDRKFNLQMSDTKKKKTNTCLEPLPCLFWTFLSLVLVFLPQSISAQEQRGTTWNADDYFKREHSLSKPYQGSGWLIPNWDFLGSTIVTNQYVRLTPDTRSQEGGLWNSVPLRARNWEVQLQFKVHGKGKDLFGDGLAFWYAKDRMQFGPVYGSKDYFMGLAVIIDTYSNNVNTGANTHGHPYISAMVNNGSLHYDHDHDGADTQLGGCEAKIRNSQYDTWISIRYENDVLTVLTDINGRNIWDPCLKVEGITLPTGYFIGLSGATGDLSDNHDLISVKTYELTAPDSQENRDNVLPAAKSYDLPKEPTEEELNTKAAGWSGLKIFFVSLSVLLIAVALGVVGVIVYQNHQQNSRKRFY